MGLAVAALALAAAAVLGSAHLQSTVSSCVFVFRLCRFLIRQKHLYRYIFKNDLVTKTGSGQTSSSSLLPNLTVAIEGDVGGKGVAVECDCRLGPAAGKDTGACGTNN